MCIIYIHNSYDFWPASLANWRLQIWALWALQIPLEAAGVLSHLTCGRTTNRAAVVKTIEPQTRKSMKTSRLARGLMLVSLRLN